MNIKENYFISFLKDYWIILFISSLNFFILIMPHFLGRYSYANDELCLIACSKRLAWGHVGFPPFSVFLLSIIRNFFGDSMLAIRFVPALASASLVFLTGIITKRLGGKKFAQVLASYIASIIPLYLLIHSFYTSNAFESLLLTCCTLLLIIIIQDEKPKHWLLLGLIMGIGLMNKHTFVVYGFSILIGMIFTSLRKYFFKKIFWLCILIVIIIILPNVIWEIQNDFVSLKFYASIHEYSTVATPFLALILIPIIAVSLNPMVFPICILGIVFLFFKTEGQPYRVLGWMILISSAFLIFMNISRIDRIAPVYPILLSSGSIMIDMWINKTNKMWLKPLFISILIIGGFFSYLISLPILPPKLLHDYVKIIKLRSNQYTESKELLNPIIHTYSTILFANRMGWESMVKDVAIMYNRLPKTDKDKAVILASNYGEAGAIELLGSKYNLPKVISVDSDYRLWGYGNTTGELIITLGYERNDLDLFFETVEFAGIVHACDYCLGYKKNPPIYVCRNLKIPMFDFFYFMIFPRKI